MGIVIWMIILAALVFLFRNTIKETIAPDKTKNYTIDDRYNAEKREREKEIDRLLSKMGKNGMNDLSEKDRKRLEELSKK
jgi:sortase (surface protein transpeptidase)